MNNTELLEEWIARLKNSDKAIIVEGKKDRNALVALGIISERIFVINESGALFHLVEKIIPLRKAIILTDLDTKGKQLYGKLSHDLQQRGVEIDNYFREFLFKNTHIRHIEGLSFLTR